MSTTPTPENTKVTDLLRKMGAVTDPDPRGPMAALDMSTHDPETIIQAEAPAPQVESDDNEDDLRRTAGHPFDRGQEGEFDPSRDPWSRHVPELGKIEVTDEEKVEFWRALWHDDLFTTTVDIRTEGRDPVSFTFRSRTQGTKELVALAVDRVVRTHPIQTISSTQVAYDYYLRLCLMTQLVAINGKPCNPHDATLEQDELAESSPHVDSLAKGVRTFFNNWSESKVMTAYKALHAFEVKLKILEDGSVNRTF